MVLIKFSLKWLNPRDGIGYLAGGTILHGSVPLSLSLSGNIFNSFQSISFRFYFIWFYLKHERLTLTPHKRDEKH